MLIQKSAQNSVFREEAGMTLLLCLQRTVGNAIIIGSMCERLSATYYI